MDKAQVQDILDDFIVKNESNFDRVSDENPILYNAVIDALDFLSSRFGTGVHTPKVVKEEVKVEENLPFKVGDTFLSKSLEPPIIFKIIDLTDSEVRFVDVEEGDSSFRFGTGIGEAVNNFEIGKWVKVEPKSVDNKAKVGDRFVVMPDAYIVLNADTYLYEITGITDTIVSIRYFAFGDVQDIDIQLSDFNYSIENGHYVIVREKDVFFDYINMDEYNIISFEPFFVKYNKGWEQTYEIPNDNFAKLVASKKLIKLSNKKTTTPQIKDEIKVGDIFQDSADDQTNFKVLSVGDENVFLEKLWNGESVTMLKNNFKKRVDTGSLIKVTEKTQAQPQEEIKIGDLFQDTADDQTIFRVSDFNGNKGNLVDFVNAWDGKFAFRLDKDKVRQKVKYGEWRRVTEQEVSSILYPKTTKTASVKKPKKTSLSKEIKELKETIEGLEAVKDFLDDGEKFELAELRKKLYDLEQKNS